MSKRNQFTNVDLREQADGTIRPKFLPGPATRRKLKAQGLPTNFELRDPHTGEWFTRDQVADFCRHRRWEPKREEDAAPAPLAQPRTRRVVDLVNDWINAIEAERKRVDAILEKNPDATERTISKSSIDSYKKSVNAIFYKPQTREEQKARKPREWESFALMNVSAIEEPEAKDFISYLMAVRGHHMGLGCRAALSAAWTWGKTNSFWRTKFNPMHDLDLARPEGRIVILFDNEIRALAAAARHLNRRSIAIGTYLGLFTGQRQGDRLTLKDEGLQDGFRRFRQSKMRGKVVEIPQTQRLAQEMELWNAVRHQLVLKHGSRPEEVIINEETGQRYDSHTYRHWFGEVRRVAIEGVIDVDATAAASLRGQNEPVYIVEPTPTLAGKRDQDLRDTAVTWLARAGCTLIEICAITGHSHKSAETIMKHYLSLSRDFAAGAIEKLEVWMKREGVKV